MKKETIKKYIFQTGHGKGLARMEIEAIFSPESVGDEVDDGFVVESNLVQGYLTLNRMGGCVRITEVVQEGPAHMPLNFEDWIVKGVDDGVKEKKGKIRYGLSMHPKSEKILTKILIGAKKRLREKLGNTRFVNKNFQNLSSVQAWHERLLDPAAVELHLFQSIKDGKPDPNGKWYLSKTVAIQDFESYSHRDYNRPARDAKNGMFPPKLAQILINLAVNGSAPTKEMTIMDPFCGSGTVLQEAWLMGFSAQGSDISSKMIADAKANLDWLKHEYQLSNAVPLSFVKDATELSKEDLPEGPFIMVSETSLGPPISRALPAHHLKNVQAELEDLYEAFFSRLKKIAPKNTVLVFTAPYHRLGNERLFLPHLPKIINRYAKIIPLSAHERQTLFFERKDQLVSREIWKIAFNSQS